jgi:hypothetical protein
LSEGQATSRKSTRAEWTGLAALFAAIYFIQGIGEPSDGLIGQPVKSLMQQWGHTTGEIGLFFTILGAPWFFKVLYGILLDTVPLWGTRRRGYLLLANGVAMIPMLALYFWPPTSETPNTLLLIALMIPTLGISFSDVGVDALMIEKGQPLGLTGRLQSVQWAANYSAVVVLGALGGWLSEGRQRFAFLIAGSFLGLAVLLTYAFVREPRVHRDAIHAPSTAKNVLADLSKFKQALNWSTVSSAVFLFLWNFNPLSSTVLQVHMTKTMQFSQSFCGTTSSIQAVGAIVASIAYGFYCRRVRFWVLIHLSILAGALSTASYWLMEDMWSAQVVAFIVGFTYLTGSLIQLELAARVCPIAVAGTTFALLMSVTNLSTVASEGVGGNLYDYWSHLFGTKGAYNILVGLGALTSVLCWLLVPALVAADRRLKKEPSPYPSPAAKTCGRGEE